MSKKIDTNGPPEEVWQEKGYFTHHNGTFNDKFVMILPPPNVTGSLHIGHALMVYIEDALVSWNRMCGKQTLWILGTDHAGIATQVVVEKKLRREEGKTRHDYGREEFISRIWQWKEEHGGKILEQVTRLGASVDWQREVFTLDDKLSKAVQEAFIQLHANGKIFRAKRLVNWSCCLRSAISNIEVETKELLGQEKLLVPGYDKPILFGTLISFAYKIKDSTDEIIVSTTRLETMLGDTAVAVHPDDIRFQHLIGKELVHPFLPNRCLKIIADPTLVQMNFGTGAVKVTPAHDPDDFECGLRHNLEFINILTDDGLINENGGKFQGQKRFDVRTELIRELKARDLFRGLVGTSMTLKYCSRSGDIIEPLIKPQWWLDQRAVAKQAIDVVRTGELKIYPPIFTDEWIQWLENVDDWCISRQLWWGHRIPAYLVWTSETDTPRDENKNWVVARDEFELKKIAAAKFGVSEDKIRFKQDDDVLDTWFSSGLMPFSVFGWPDQTNDLEQFYPGTLLETGRDILFFWVARMVMLGLDLTGRLPFSTVYLHAIIRDASGKKMSKSSGNVIDPLDIIDGISLEQLQEKLTRSNLTPKEHSEAQRQLKINFPTGIKSSGTDALRFALCDYTSHTRDINLNIKTVGSAWSFCNKLWQATRCALILFEENFKPDDIIKPSPHLIDKWILSKLASTVKIVNRALKTYNFSQATYSLHTFFKEFFCDVYLEAIKPIVRSQDQHNYVLQTLYTCLEISLKLLHPFMPYITEELYQQIPRRQSSKESIMISPFPQVLQSQTNEHPIYDEDWQSDTPPASPYYDAVIEEEFSYVEKINQAIRATKQSYMRGSVKKQDPRVFVYMTSKHQFSVFTKYKTYSNTLVWCSNLILIPEQPPAFDGCLTVVDESCTVYVELY